MRALYAERQAVLVSAAQNELSGLLEVLADKAGTHLIGWLPNGVNAKSVSQKASAQGVITNPLSAYSSKKLPREGLILGYTAFTPGQIRNGVKRLAKILC
jgi:GntR family transcriptional regulator/MocR family aminotransferase